MGIFLRKNQDKTKHNSRSYFIISSLIILSSVLVYTTAIANPPEKKQPSLQEQGLNQYIDPSKNPKYHQIYHEINFIGEGIPPEELADINSLVNFKDNSIEEPQALIGGKTIPISQIQSGQKIRKISYNSNPEDTKVLELNYYRGKNENLEIKKSQQKLLKEKNNINTEEQKFRAKLDQDISQISQKIEKNKANWNKKIQDNKSKVEKIKNKIETTNSSSNKELMDILYPSQEQIDNLNNEILEERRQIKELGLDKIWKREELKQRIVSTFLPQVQAEYLSNFVSSLVVYPRSNMSLRIDLKGNGVYNGNEFHLWTANGGNAQKFRFIDETGEIKYAANEGYCLDRNGNAYHNGAKIQLYQCNGSEAQKWIAFANGEIKPLHNLNFCIDARDGVNQASTLHLHQCHGGSNQIFQIGEEDFGKFQYSMRIHSSESIISGGEAPTGHTLISMPKREISNNYWHITNTFGFWKLNSSRDSNNTNWNNGRTNNMRNVTVQNTWSLLNVDGGGGDNNFDWNVGIAHPADAGGEFGGFRRTTSGISKQKYEEIKYMRGYQIYNPSQGNAYINSWWDIGCTTCATYALLLWNPNTDSINFGSCSTPGQIYNVL